jgi:hypothetical protein
MTFFKWLSWLNFDWGQPKPYGLFHLLSWVVLVGLAACVIFFSKKIKTEKGHRIVLLVSASIMLFFEVIKQIIINMNTDGTITTYFWREAPFVPCSFFMYITFAISFFKKDSKFRQAIYMFLAAYGLFSGLTAFVQPSAIFEGVGGEFVGGQYINQQFKGIIFYQSIQHHGLMILTGLYLFVSGRVKITHKNFAWASVVFTACCAVGLTLNIIFHYALPSSMDGIVTGNYGNYFNAMQINPWLGPNLPIVDVIFKDLPAWIWIPVYMILYSALAYVVFMIAWTTKYTLERYHTKKEVGETKTNNVKENNNEIKNEQSIKTENESLSKDKLAKKNKKK